MRLRNTPTDPPLPPDLRRTVLHWFGEAGRIWCDTLPENVARLLDLWQVSPGATLAGATHSLVLDCARTDGSPAVLKLPFLDDENRAEADALRLYGGDGAVRLLGHDPTTGALLLERLYPGAPYAPSLTAATRWISPAASCVASAGQPRPGIGFRSFAIWPGSGQPISQRNKNGSDIPCPTGLSAKPPGSPATLRHRRNQPLS